MEPNFRLIGEHIRNCRLGQNMSQALLAERADLSIPYISQVETAQKHISLRALIRIANVLNVSVDTLLRGSQNAASFPYPAEMERLFADCTAYEQNIILDSAAALKNILRNHKATSA